MIKRNQFSSKIIIGFFLTLFLTVIVFLAYQHASFKKSPLVSPLPESSLHPVGDTTKFPLDLTPPPPPEDIFNVLLLGQGDPSHEGSQLTDSLLVIHLDTQKKLAAFISVPRDTWISLPEITNKSQNRKINEAYVVGRQFGGEKEGLGLAKKAVETVTDLPIHYSILIDFNGFVQAIDALGAIEVAVPKTFDDYFYPIKGKELETCGKTPEELSAINATLSGFQLEKQFTCRYEHLHFNAGKNIMNGEAALKFVRSRHSDQSGGDFARAERQQALLLGIKDKLISLDGLKKAPEFFEKMKNLVKTDLDLEAVKTVTGLIIDPDQYRIIKITLSTDNVFNSGQGPVGQFILVPKAGADQWSTIHQFISNQIKSDI